MRSAVAIGLLVFGLHAPLVTGAAAQPIPPPTGSVAPNGDYAFSTNFKYDPSKCSRDPEGMVYFAIGRRVLRQPMDNLGYMMVSPSERRAMPHVRHPEEAWGCPDRPLQMSVYHLNRISDVTGRPAGPASAGAEAIRVIMHDGEPFRQNKMVRLACSHDTPDFTVQGFVGCRGGACDTYRYYEATVYTEPNETKLAVTCKVWSVITPCQFEDAVCQGGYSLSDQLTLNLTFGVNFLSVENFVDADKELRRRVLEAEVKDFVWANEAP